jgi:hypothetical protein
VIQTREARMTVRASDRLLGCFSRSFCSLRFHEDDPVEAQQLAERPGLKRAALWLKWRLGIGNFRKMPKAKRLDTCQQGKNDLGGGVTPRRYGVASHANPRVNEWTDQPWPDGSLMIDSVSRRRITFRARGITRLAGRERPQSDRFNRASWYLPCPDDDEGLIEGHVSAWPPRFW